MKEFKFFLITDTHYFENSLGAYGEEYERFMDFEQKCFAETESIDRAVFAYLEAAKDADTVLIAGDLSFNGEKKSHEGFLKLLKALKASGKTVYVVTAGHDINQHPFAFDSNGRKEPEGTDFSELYGYYHDYGYDSAIAFNKEHLSYVAQLCDGLRLLVLCNDGEEGRSLAYSDDLYDWIREQTDRAKADNQMMIAMEHYPVLAGQPILELVPDARQKESKRLIEALADNGVHLIFTGHMHNHSINVVKTEKGNSFYDVCTGSVIGCPAFMRLVTVKDESTVEIKSIPVPEFDWDKKGKTGEVYLKDQFERMIKSMIYGMRDDPKRILDRFGAGDKKALYKPVKFFGKALGTWSVGKVARLFCISADKKIKNDKFLDLAINIVRYMFEGDQPYVEGTPEGDTVLKVLRHLKPILNKLNKKLHGSQGESVDLYEMLKNSIGNYGISDNNAVLKL